MNAEGQPDKGGRIVLLALGMSNTTMEFSQFVQKANTDPRKAAEVVVVDGAQGGKDATAWATAAVAERQEKAAFGAERGGLLVHGLAARGRVAGAWPAGAVAIVDEVGAQEREGAGKSVAPEVAGPEVAGPADAANGRGAPVDWGVSGAVPAPGAVPVVPVCGADDVAGAVVVGVVPVPPVPAVIFGTDSTVVSRWISPTRSYWVWPF